MATQPIPRLRRKPLVDPTMDVGHRGAHGYPGGIAPVPSLMGGGKDGPPPGRTAQPNAALPGGGGGDSGGGGGPAQVPLPGPKPMPSGPKPPIAPNPLGGHTTLSPEEWALKFPGKKWPGYQEDFSGDLPGTGHHGAGGGTPVHAGGGGGAPPAYAPPAAAGGPDAPGAGDDQQNFIWHQIRGMLNGQTSFSPAVVDAMKGQLLSATRGQENAQIAASDEDLASRGIFRSGIAAEQTAGIRAAGAQAYTSGTRDILVKKALQDFQDKKDAIDRAQNWLNSMRDWIVQNDRNDIAKEQSLAQIQLGYANLTNAYNIAQLNANTQLQIANSQHSGGGQAPLSGFNGSPLPPPGH